MTSFFGDLVGIMYRPSTVYHHIRERYLEEKPQRAHYLLFVVLGLANALLALVLIQTRNPEAAANEARERLARVVVPLVFGLAGCGGGAIQWCARASVSHLLMRLMGKTGDFDELLLLSSYTFVPNLVTVILLIFLYRYAPGLSGLDRLPLLFTGFGPAGIARLINVAASLFSIYLLFHALRTVYDGDGKLKPLLAAGLGFGLSVLAMMWPDLVIPERFFR